MWWHTTTTQNKVRFLSIFEIISLLHNRSSLFYTSSVIIIMVVILHIICYNVMFVTHCLLKTLVMMMWSGGGALQFSQSWPNLCITWDVFASCDQVSRSYEWQHRHNPKKCKGKFAGKRSHDHIRHARMWIGCSRFQAHDVTGETQILIRGCKLKLIRQAWFILHCLQYIVCHSGYFRILQPWQHFVLIISLFPIISYNLIFLLHC